MHGERGNVERLNLNWTCGLGTLMRSHRKLCVAFLGLMAGCALLFPWLTGCNASILLSPSPSVPASTVSAVPGSPIQHIVVIMQENRSFDNLFMLGGSDRLARALGVKVIHCSERDTQVASIPKAVDEFVNTWSVEGFHEEGTTTAEMGWGTHEKWLPPMAYRHTEGPRNQICLARMGINTWVRSWVPIPGSIHGMVIRHGEAFSISESLTVEERQAPVPPHRPLCLLPVRSAIASLPSCEATTTACSPVNAS